MKKKWRIVLVGLLVTGTTISLYTWKEFTRTHADTAKLEAAFTYGALTLVEEFQKDESTANAKLNDKVIAVKGNISKIDIGDSTQSVFLGVDESIGAVLCQFDASHKEELAKLKEGEAVTIKGVCTGILMDVILTRCVLDKP